MGAGEEERVSKDLVKRWRRLAREHYEAAIAIEKGRLQGAAPNEAASMRSYGEALTRCAASLERSMRRARKAQR